MRKFSMTGPHIRGRSDEEDDLETGVTHTRIEVLTKVETSTCESEGSEQRDTSGNMSGGAVVVTERNATHGSPG